MGFAVDVPSDVVELTKALVKASECINEIFAGDWSPVSPIATQAVGYGLFKSLGWHDHGVPAKDTVFERGVGAAACAWETPVDVASALKRVTETKKRFEQALAAKAGVVGDPNSAADSARSIELVAILKILAELVIDFLTGRATLRQFQVRLFTRILPALIGLMPSGDPAWRLDPQEIDKEPGTLVEAALGLPPASDAPAAEVSDPSPSPSGDDQPAEAAESAAAVPPAAPSGDDPQVSQALSETVRKTEAERLAEREAAAEKSPSLL